jgi:predicted lipid-binding transport protein (Tim44 family)
LDAAGFLAAVAFAAGFAGALAAVLAAGFAAALAGALLVAAAAVAVAVVFAAVLAVVVFSGARSSLTVSFVDVERGVAMLTPFAGGRVRLGST